MGSQVVEVSRNSPENVYVDEYLNKIEMFQYLPTNSVKQFEKRIHVMEYRKGATIISEFEQAKGIYFVHSGIVKLTKQDAQGNELIVAIKKKGEIFAEACLFNDPFATYPATATMLKQGKVCFIHTADIEQELLAAPELSVQMIRYMSGALRELTSTMRDIALLDVYTKSIIMIEKLADRFGVKKSNRMLIEIPITVQEFSTLVGTSRESTSRVFSKLKRDGLIEVKEKKITITDWCRFSNIFHNVSI